MATPRTQNWRSSSADRSTRLACVPWQVALITLILTVCSAAVAANRIGRSNLICAVVSIRLVTGVLALIAAGRWIVHPHLVLHWISQVQWRAALAVLMLAAMFTATAAKAQTITLLSAGGATIAGGTNVYTSSFGNMNALGAGTAGISWTRTCASLPLRAAEAIGRSGYAPIRVELAGLKGDWLSGRAPRSHRGGHWFEPSIAHRRFRRSAAAAGLRSGRRRPRSSAGRRPQR